MGAGASQPKVASAPTKSVEPIKVSAGGSTRQTKPAPPRASQAPAAVKAPPAPRGGDGGETSSDEGEVSLTSKSSVPMGVEGSWATQQQPGDGERQRPRPLPLPGVTFSSPPPGKNAASALKPLGQPLTAPPAASSHVIDASPGSYAGRQTNANNPNRTDTARASSGSAAGTTTGYTPPVMPLPTGVGDGVASTLAALAAQGKAHETLLRSLVAMMNAQQQQMTQLLHAVQTNGAQAAAAAAQAQSSFPAAGTPMDDERMPMRGGPMARQSSFPAEMPAVVPTAVAPSASHAPHPLDGVLDASMNPAAVAKLQQQQQHQQHQQQLQQQQQRAMPAKLPELSSANSQFPPLRASGGALAPLAPLGSVEKPAEMNARPQEDPLVLQLRKEQEALRAASEAEALRRSEAAAAREAEAAARAAEVAERERRRQAEADEESEWLARQAADDAARAAEREAAEARRRAERDDAQAVARRVQEEAAAAAAAERAAEAERLRADNERLRQEQAENLRQENERLKREQAERDEQERMRRLQEEQDRLREENRRMQAEAEERRRRQDMESNAAAMPTRAASLREQHAAGAPQRNELLAAARSEQNSVTPPVRRSKGKPSSNGWGEGSAGFQPDNSLGVAGGTVIMGNPNRPRRKPGARGGGDGGGDGAAMPDSMKILEGIMTSTQNAEKKRQEQEEAHRRAQLDAEQKAKDAASAEAAKARPQHIMALARHLGIDPVFDTDLLWIAEKAFDAPLPSGWSAHHDAGGNEYYYNASDGTTCWEHPMEAHFRSLALQQLQEKERKKAIERNLGKGQAAKIMNGGKAKKHSLGLSSKSSFDDSYASNATDATDDDDDLLLETMNSVSTLNETQDSLLDTFSSCGVSHSSVGTLNLDLSMSTSTSGRIDMMTKQKYGGSGSKRGKGLGLEPRTHDAGGGGGYQRKQTSLGKVLNNIRMKKLDEDSDEDSYY